MCLFLPLHGHYLCCLLLFGRGLIQLFIVSWTGPCARNIEILCSVGKKTDSSNEIGSQYWLHHPPLQFSANRKLTADCKGGDLVFFRWRSDSFRWPSHWFLSTVRLFVKKRPWSKRNSARIPWRPFHKQEKCKYALGASLRKCDRLIDYSLV